MKSIDPNSIVSSSGRGGLSHSIRWSQTTIVVGLSMPLLMPLWWSNRRWRSNRAIPSNGVPRIWPVWRWTGWMWCRLGSLMRRRAGWQRILLGRNQEFMSAKMSVMRWKSAWMASKASVLICQRDWTCFMTDCVPSKKKRQLRLKLVAFLRTSEQPWAAMSRINEAKKRWKHNKLWA